MRKRATLKDANAPKKIKPAYVLPPPNDDIEAYGWDMSKLRYPQPESESKKDPEPGRHIFDAPEASWENMQRYGHNLQFLCPQYIQLMLDRVAAVREAAQEAADARYTKESIEKIRAAIDHAFIHNILPEIQRNFEQVSGMLAQFYAARIAHIKKFGKP